MILRAVCVFSVIMLTAETLPFTKMNIRTASVSQPGQNFRKLRSTFHRVPTYQSWRKFSGHPSSRIRQPVLHFSDMSNQGEEKFSGFRPSRYRKTPSRFFFSQYLSNIHHNMQQHGKKLRHFGQRVRDKLQHHAKCHSQRIQNLKEMLDHKFRLDAVKGIRLKQAFLNKKALTNKLHHRFGLCSKFVAVPYHTMNDDHMIVKRPGVNFHSHYRPSNEIPISVPAVSAIKPIATEHPVLPEVTTSVNFHQESNLPATTAGYMFPITSIAAHTPEVIEATEITKYPIGQDEMTTPRLPSSTSHRNGASVSTTVTEGTILEASTIKTAFYEAGESEKFEGIDREEVTDIGSTLFPSSSVPQTTWQIYTNEPPTSQTNMLVDLMSRIQVKPITSSLANVESTTTEIRPIFPAAITITDDDFASTIIDIETAIAPIIPIFGSTLSTLNQTTLGTEATSLRPPAPETTTIPDGIFGIMDAASPGIKPESTSETIPTFLFIISTETPTATDAISTTINTEIVSTISPETTSESLAVSELTPFGYNRFPSYTEEIEIESIGVDVTFPSTSQTETTKVVTERLTIFDSASDYLTTEMEPTVEIFSMIPSGYTTEISTTTESVYSSSANNGETTMEIVSTPPAGTISPETTSSSSPASEITPLVDTSSTFGYDRFSSFTDEVKTTTRTDSTFSSTIPTQIAIIVTEKSTTVDQAFEHSTIDMERTTEIVSNFPSTISPETTTIFEAASTATGSEFDEGITEDTILLTFSPTVPTEVSEIVTHLDALPSLAYNHFTNSTNQPETTSEAHSTLPSTIPTGTATTSTEGFMSVDLSIDGSALDVEIATENVSPAISTNSDELSTTIDSVSTSDGYTTSEIASTLPTTIFPETNSWPSPALEITPLVEVLSTFEYNYRFSSSTEETTEVDSTFPAFTIPAETTTTSIEGFISVDSAFDSHTVDVEINTENVSPLYSAISTVTPPISNELSTTMDPASTSNGDTTSEIVSTLQSTIFPKITSRALPALEITPRLDVLSRFEDEYNRFPSYIDTVKEAYTEVDSTFLSTIQVESTTMATNGLTTVKPAFNNSPINTERTTEIVSVFSSTLLTEATTTLEEISTSTPSDYSSINEGTTMEMISTSSSKSRTDDSTFFSGIPTEIITTVTERWTISPSSMLPTETIKNSKEISGAAHPTSNGSTHFVGETTTEIVSTLPTTISTVTTTLPSLKYDSIAERNFEYLDENQANNDVRISRLLHANSEFVLPRFARNSEEELDEKRLLLKTYVESRFWTPLET